MRTKILFFALLSLGLSACALLERSNQSGYAFEEGPSSTELYMRDKRMKAFNAAREELGVTSEVLSDSQISSIRNRVELSRLEKTLQYDLEKKQYYSLKPYFNSDLERIYFLKLPSRDARERWATQKGINANDTRVDSGTAKLIENNDISRGMTKNAVKQSWGEPDFVEVAGNPLYGNERWRYAKQVSTADGYKNESRVVYFESGRVAGWETF